MAKLCRPACRESSQRRKHCPHLLRASVSGLIVNCRRRSSNVSAGRSHNRPASYSGRGRRAHACACCLLASFQLLHLTPYLHMHSIQVPGSRRGVNCFNWAPAPQAAAMHGCTLLLRVLGACLLQMPVQSSYLPYPITVLTTPDDGDPDHRQRG